MEKEQNVYFGILPLQIPIPCKRDVLGEGFHTQSCGLDIKMGLPETGEDTASLIAPGVIRGYGLPIRWGTLQGDTAWVRALFFGFQGTEAEAGMLWKDAEHRVTKLQNLCLLNASLPENPPEEIGRMEEMLLYRMDPDGSIRQEYCRHTRTMPSFQADMAPVDVEALDGMIQDAASESVIEKSYTMLLGACRAWIDGDDYTAGVLSGAAVEMAAEKYIVQHEEGAEENGFTRILEGEKETRFEKLAQLGLTIPGDWEDRIITVYGDMKFGHLTPDHDTIRDFIEKCRQVMKLCVPKRLIHG